MRILPTPIDVEAPVVRAAGPVDITDPQDFPIEEIWAAPGGVVYLSVIGGLKAHIRTDPKARWDERTSWEWHVPDDAVRIWASEFILQSEANDAEDCASCMGDES